MTKNNIYDYILNLCVAQSGNFTKPFIRNGMVYATNSFLAVRMPADRTENVFEEGKTEVEAVFEKDKTTDLHNIYMRTNELLGVVSQYGMYLNNRKNCVACHGNGEEECFHCGNMTECETCVGKGTTGYEVPTATFAFRDHTMMLDDKHFSPLYLHTVALVAAALRNTEIKIECRGEKAYIKYDDGTEMIVMMQHK